ncbi:hypothetical protein [Methylosinus sp. RM1]|uniref:hypothetical protein n=1 Tax=Methylosinus sp. RM1 TaxID=2583817 RepID=UPI001407331B|nr:hypothetical protein [Methylosinus sp. RM1]
MSTDTSSRRNCASATIKGWFDDSRRDDVWAIGGYAGADHRWEYFDHHWPIALAKHGVPYLHMKEANEAKGVYAKWWPSKEHQAEWSAFLNELAEIIYESRLQFFASIVRLEDLERFNREHGVGLKPYALAAYGCMVVVAREYGELSSELVFDHLEKVDSKLSEAKRYADLDSYNRGDFDRMSITALAKTRTFRDLPAMQAADFAVWELRKHHEKNGEWFDLPDRPLNEDERWEHFQRWSIAKFQTLIPPPRKSLSALVEGNQIFPLIWDYDRLCEAHRLRNGLWC